MVLWLSEYKKNLSAHFCTYGGRPYSELVIRGEGRNTRYVKVCTPEKGVMKLVVCSSGMYRVCLWQLSEPTPATSSSQGSKFQEQRFPL